jgi:hypothetical protein
MINEFPSSERRGAKQIPIEVREARERIRQGVTCEACNRRPATGLIRRVDAMELLVCDDCMQLHSDNELFRGERIRRALPQVES